MDTTQNEEVIEAVSEPENKSVTHLAANSDTNQIKIHNLLFLPIVACKHQSRDPKILPEAVSPKEALQLLEQITRLPSRLFWADSIALVDTVLFKDANIIGYRQITDAYLVSLAIHNNGCLVSFDKGIATLVPDSCKDRLKILE